MHPRETRSEAEPRRNPPLSPQARRNLAIVVVDSDRREGRTTPQWIRDLANGIDTARAKSPAPKRDSITPPANTLDETAARLRTDLAEQLDAITGGTGLDDLTVGELRHRLEALGLRLHLDACAGDVRVPLI